VKLEDVRKVALALPDTTEEPHHNFGSFRVRGKIFVTIPPGGDLLHIFLPVEQRELALVLQQQLSAAVDPLALDDRRRQQPDQAAPAKHAQQPRRRHVGEQLGQLLPPRPLPEDRVAQRLRGRRVARLVDPRQLCGTLGDPELELGVHARRMAQSVDSPPRRSS